MWKTTMISPYYSVDENGNVKRNAYTRIDKVGRKTQIKEMKLKPNKDKYGYYRVTLITGLDKPCFIPVHKLVASAFIENSNNYSCINHIDENKENNNVNNLEWCTIAYNNCYGSRNKNAKATLTKRYGTKVKSIKNNDVQVFNSVSEASRKLKVRASNIFNCLSGAIKSTGGYKFEKIIESEVI